MNLWTSLQCNWSVIILIVQNNEKKYSYILFSFSFDAVGFKSLADVVLISIGILPRHFMVKRMKISPLKTLKEMLSRRNCWVSILLQMRRFPHQNPLYISWLILLVVCYLLVSCVFSELNTSMPFLFRFLWRMVHMDTMFSLEKTRKDTFPSGLRFHRYFDKHFIELGCEFFHMYKYQFSAFILL